jgi:hypothetical protein
MELAEALELVSRLSRTKNYPRDEAGVVYLAEGLARAASAAGVDARHIVMVCATTSEWCPTDADLVTIANQIRDEQRRAQEALLPPVTAQWKRKYGEPKPFDWKALDTDRIKRVKAREAEMLSAIKAKYPGELSWAGMIQAAKELGYLDYAEAWEKGMR